MTLARQYSLKARDFDLVKNKGQLFQSPSFAFIYLKKPSQKAPHFGFIVSTKISPHSSVRNKAKRALSEGVRTCLYVLKPNYDFVFLAKPIIIKKYTSEIMKEVSDALYKAGLTK